MTALGASIGTGNIAGVATAVVSGGPGTVFWIWCYGFFAMAIKLTEAILGIRFRSFEGGRLQAGPSLYLRDGMRLPWLGWLYALVAGVAALTTTALTAQPNSIAVVMESELGVKTWVSGLVLAVLAWLVIIGGIRSIGRAAQAFDPPQVGLYLLGGLIVILVHLAELPRASRGHPSRGFLARGRRWGERSGRRGHDGHALWPGPGHLRERGGADGTAAVAYGTARSDQPIQQGLNAVVEVFVVSFVTSSISARTILLSGAWNGGRTSTGRGGPGFRFRHSRRGTGGGRSASFSSATPPSSVGLTTASSSSSTCSARA